VCRSASRQGSRRSAFLARRDKAALFRRVQAPPGDRSRIGSAGQQRCWCFDQKIYACRAGRNVQEAAVEMEELLFRGYSEVVDADLADYFGSIPHADLLKSVAQPDR
jgi:hypothetical protein